MKTSIAYGRSALFIAILAWAAMIPPAGGAAAAGQEALPAQIRSAIERSPLPGQGKGELLDAAGRAVRAGIPADDVEIIITRARDRGAGAGITGELLDTVVKAREKDLPIRPLLNRVEQGLSKGVPPERISAAARTLSEKLSQARPIVGGLIRSGVRPGADKDREYAVETVARALERSIPADLITRTGRQVGERGGSVVLFDKAVHTMTSLTENGMPLESASRLVRSAVDKGFTEKDLTKMERDVAEGLEKGKRVDDVVRSTESEITHEHRGEDRGGERGRGGSRESGSGRGKDRVPDRGGHGGKGGPHGQ